MNAKPKIIQPQNIELNVDLNFHKSIKNDACKITT